MSDWEIAVPAADIEMEVKMPLEDFADYTRTTEILAIRDFVKRVDEAAEADILAGNPITGAHHRAIRRVLAEKGIEI
jgi:hypothetical protein